MEKRIYIPDFTSYALTTLRRVAREIEWKYPEEAATLKGLAREIDEREIVERA